MLVVLTPFLFALCIHAAAAQADSQLKSATPKLDVPTPAPSPPAPPKQGPSTLHGKVEHSHTLLDPGFPGMFGSAKGGASDNSLRGRARSNMLNSGLSTGIGIIGVKFVLFAGRAPTINLVFPLTPAAESGLRPDDVIIAVDGVPTQGLRKEEIYDMITGTPGTPVTISIERSGNYRAYSMMRMNLNDLSDSAVRRDYLRSL